MVEFYNPYNDYAGLQYENNITGHGAIYGSSSCGKSTLVQQLCLNGQFSHCRTLIFLNGKTGSLPIDFVKTMEKRWNTVCYCYRVNNEEELQAKIESIEEKFLCHRKAMYKEKEKESGENVDMPEEVDMRDGFSFANVKIIIDDLHKEVVKSDSIARKFQSIRHSGIELLFVTQSFKNINMHDLIKENLMFVIIFKLSQNQVTLRRFLQDLSHKKRARTNRAGGECGSSLEYIYDQMVVQNGQVPTFSEEETCYIYIAMPKRGSRRVSDVRAAVSNPNRQICFKEISCNDCKILFSRRKNPLTYDNRMDRKNVFLVLSDVEQRKELESKDEIKKPEDKFDEIESENDKIETPKSNNEDSDRSPVKQDGSPNKLVTPQRQRQQNFLKDDMGCKRMKNRMTVSKERRKPEVLTSESEGENSDAKDISPIYYKPPHRKVNGLIRRKRININSRSEKSPTSFKSRKRTSKNFNGERDGDSRKPYNRPTKAIRATSPSFGNDPNRL